MTALWGRVVENEYFISSRTELFDWYILSRRARDRWDNVQQFTKSIHVGVVGPVSKRNSVRNENVSVDKGNPEVLVCRTRFGFYLTIVSDQYRWSGEKSDRIHVHWQMMIRRFATKLLSCSFSEKYSDSYSLCSRKRRTSLRGVVSVKFSQLKFQRVMILISWTFGFVYDIS